MAVVIAMMLQSCYVTRTTVGNGPVGKESDVKVFSREKQVAILYGLVALNQPNPSKPTDNNYQIVTSFNVVDGIIKYLTGGLVTTETVKVVVKNK